MTDGLSGARDGRQRKLVVFTRAHPDIDHMVPVLYKWGQLSDIPAALVHTGDRSLLEDYRINYLRELGRIEISHVEDFVGVSATGRRSLRRLKHHLKRAVARLLPDALVERLRRGVAGSAPTGLEPAAVTLLDALTEGNQQAAIAFDWTYTPLARAVTSEARRRGHVTVSLPHGDRPYYNRMFSNSILSYEPQVSEPSYYDLYDHIVVPNQVAAGQDPHWRADLLRVLGSPRFNGEWQAIVDSWISPYRNADAEHCFKLVLFLRDGGYPINYRELVTSIRMLQQFEGLYIVLKHHTRRLPHGGDLSVLGELAAFTNVRFVGEEVTSSALIAWADLVLDLGTSIAYEAVKKGVPVLSLDYMHANHTTLAHYLPTGDLRYRDDLYDWIARLLADGTEGFYDEEARTRFLNEIVDYPDSDVLTRYVRFLEGCFDEAPSAPQTVVSGEKLSSQHPTAI